MSFYYALSGFLWAVKNEKNMRFHIVIANLIVVFAYFYGLSRIEWLALILCVGMVISAELFNTGIEKAVDIATEEIRPLAKAAKDTAAAGVLILAIASILVGVCIFGDFERIQATLIHIFTNAKILIPCLILGIFDILFLICGGKNDRKIRKKDLKNKTCNFYLTLTTQHRLYL